MEFVSKVTIQTKLMNQLPTWTLVLSSVNIDATFNICGNFVSKNNSFAFTMVAANTSMDWRRKGEFKSTTGASHFAAQLTASHGVAI